MSEILPPHVIDASERFRTKEALAGYETGTDELRLIRDSIAIQPQAFIDEINGWCPELGEHLLELANKGVRCHLFRELYQDDNSHQSIRDDDFAVLPVMNREFESKDLDSDMQPQIEMRINIDAVERAHEIVGLLFAGKAETQVVNTRRLQLASSLVSWMALAKWAFDNIEPGEVGQDFDNHQMAAVLQAAGYSEACTGKMSINDAKLFIRDVLTDLRYRFVGYFAYKQMQKFSSMHDDMESFGLDEIAVFHRLYPIVYMQLKKYNPKRISTIEYALANPLLDAEAKRVVAEFC